MLLLGITLSACKSTEPMNTAAGEAPATPAPMEMAQAENVDAAGSMLDDIVAKHARARGAENLTSIETLKWNGEAAMMGMNMPVTLYIKRPDKIRTEVDITAMNMEFVSGFNGSEGWVVNPAMGPTPQSVPKNQVQLMKDQADIDGFLVNYKEKGHILEYEGEEMVRDKPAHKIKLVREGQSDVYLYLDAESYLEVKTEGQGVDPQSGALVRMENYMSDYRPVNGVMMPHTMEIYMGGQPFQTVAMHSIDVNVEMDNGMFEMPGARATPSTN